MSKKDKILKEATKLITQEGINGSPMSQIAKKAGVAVGTIYHHFKSKEEIINEIYVSIRKKVGDVIIESSKNIVDLKKEFKSVSLAIYVYYVNNPIEYSFLNQLEHSPIITKESHAESEKYFAPIFESYQNAIELGVFINMDLMLMGMLTYNNIITLVELSIKAGNISPEIVDQAIEFSWRGIAKPL
ncbi:MAG: TetR/AcrR family transcriptional repressor of multidrug resistance operon [Crocinitomix sp.]|jgi:TetR/AcrR family transcriptional repressor of multidrug resistance operon